MAKEKEKETSSRSNEIRRQRTERVRKPARTGTTRRSRKIGAPYQPPVVVRWGHIGSPAAERQVGKKARRRFDVALSAVPGAEIRLPSLPSIRFGWRLVSALLVAVLALALYTVWNSDLYKVDMVEIDGLKRISKTDLNAVIGVTGASILQVNPAKIHAAVLAAFPELSSATIQVSVPATVVVQVVERQPVLTWKQDGKLMLVDAAGVAFPPRVADPQEGVIGVLVEAESSPAAAAAAAPAVAAAPEAAEAKAPGRFLPPQLVTAILAMSTHAPEDTPLLFTQEHGLGWKDPRGWQVFFGAQTGEMESKLRVYEAIIKTLKKDQIKPALVSVEYLHAPYYRLEQ